MSTARSGSGRAHGDTVTWAKGELATHGPLMATNGCRRPDCGYAIVRHRGAHIRAMQSPPAICPVRAMALRNRQLCSRTVPTRTRFRTWALIRHYGRRHRRMIRIARLCTPLRA
jgi:hypothetical protein